MTWDRSSLARAYVGAGDEAGAIRVFRLSGMVEGRIAAELQDFCAGESLEIRGLNAGPLVAGTCDA